ncbi:MDR family MFS transporter [Saccharothrix variisporea]|nr:MDR family MFS transporter [Saccharothrix variisporea]
MAGTTDARPEPTGVAVRAVLVGLLTGVFMSALDGMIMATALRTVADSLHGLTAQAWVTTAYLMTMTISAPLYGKLSDIFGRKRLYLVAIALFVLGSLLCALAQGIHQLAVCRGVQGLGAGGLASLALAAIADMFPPRQRIRYQANIGILYGVASVAGPVVGGLLAGADTILGVPGWRWIFLVNLPIGLVALLVVGRLYTDRSTRAGRRVDHWGAAALIACLVPLLLVAEQGREWGWSSGRALAAYAAGLAGLVAFLLVERRLGDDALLPPRLFRARGFTRVNVINFLGGVGAFTATAFIPLYLQVVKGMSPTTAGLLLLPQSLATTVGAKLCGPIMARTGRYKVLLAPGLAIMSASYFALAAVGVDTPLWITAGLVVVMGLGFGMFMQTVLTALQNSVPPENMGVASGLYGFARQIGGIAGTAVFLSLLFNLAAGRIVAAASAPEAARVLADSAVAADPANRAVAEGLRAGTAGIDLDDTSGLAALDPRLARPILEGLSGAMSTVFLIIACLVAAAAAFALTIAEHKRDPATAPRPPRRRARRTPIGDLVE